MRRKGRGVTIDEVATLAGVSPMTVSRVMNNQGKVRDTTRERVLQAVRELDYTPNLAASSLAAAQHTRIALVYNNPSGAYLREMLVGLLRVASRTSIQLVIDYWEHTDADAERKAARAMAGKVDGVILPPPVCESHAAVSEFVRAGIPVVAIAAGRSSDEISCVRIDDLRAGKELADYLIARGHTRIGFIKGRPDLSASARRYEGFQTAMFEAGLPIDEVAQRIYTEVNNGVYRCGFAGSQDAYEKAYDRLFTALDWLTERLSAQRYLVGDTITEADVRLFTTLARFDPVYHGHFKCNRSKLSEMPVLWAYARDLWTTPGFGDTTDVVDIKRHYYEVHRDINPTGVVPQGPELMGWLEPHGREALGGSPFGDGTPPGPPPEGERVPVAHNPTLGEDGMVRTR